MSGCFSQKRSAFHQPEGSKRERSALYQPGGSKRERSAFHQPEGSKRERSTIHQPGGSKGERSARYSSLQAAENFQGFFRNFSVFINTKAVLWIRIWLNPAKNKRADKSQFYF